MYFKSLSFVPLLFFINLLFLLNILENVTGKVDGEFRNIDRMKLRRHHISSKRLLAGETLNEHKKPNIILFLTDDQDIELGSLNFMKKTLKHMRDPGAEFRHAYATTPMCCPSRSSILTGLYMHNHNVFTNNENCSSTEWQAIHEPRTFANYLSNVGYRTGYFGKYLNKYNGSYVPPGWREWGGQVLNSRYYNYTVNMNGKKIKHGNDYHLDYFTDVVVNDSVRFLRQSKQSFSKKPVLLVMSFPAPHGPEDSAPQFSKMFFNVTTHHTPSYDYAPNKDKQWILQVTGKMEPIHKHFTDLLMTKRLQTLQSVDDGVERIINELRDLGELDNTFFIYTSDHGYHLGQFGLVKGKFFPFEFDIRVPFLIRGPGIAAGLLIDDPVLNIDIAPTILDMAGIVPPQHMDGRSMLKLLFRKKHQKRNELKWPDTFLVESSGRRPDKPQHHKNGNDERNNKSLSNDIQINLDHLSKADKLMIECQKPEYQNPCKAGQKWKCIYDGSRWRKQKCKSKSSDGNTACACFNADGKMYLYNPNPARVERDDLSRVINSRPKIFRQLKNDKALENIVKMAYENPRKNKRQTGAGNLKSHMSAMQKNLKQRIFDLRIFYNGTIAKCRTMKHVVVFCSEDIYTNAKLWRLIKSKIYKQMRKLYIRLTHLREIGKHLDKYDPSNNWSLDNTTSLPIDVNKEHNNTSTTFDMNLSTTTETSNKHRHHHANKSYMTNIETNGLQEHKGKSMSSKITNITHNAPSKQTINRKYHNQLADLCYCSNEDGSMVEKQKPELDIIQKEKKSRKEKKLRRKKKLENNCFADKKMYCFLMDNDHWKTEPVWTEGQFCSCVNSNNNTYSCLRTINATHNYLYCEFETGFITYYNLRIDPFQQWNRAYSLHDYEQTWLHNSLQILKKCKGSRDCHLGSHASISNVQPTTATTNTTTTATNTTTTSTAMPIALLNITTLDNEPCVNCNNNNKRNRSRQRSTKFIAT